MDNVRCVVCSAQCAPTRSAHAATLKVCSMICARAPQLVGTRIVVAAPPAPALIAGRAEDRAARAAAKLQVAEAERAKLQRQAQEAREVSGGPMEALAAIDAKLAGYAAIAEERRRPHLEALAAIDARLDWYKQRADEARRPAQERLASITSRESALLADKDAEIARLQAKLDAAAHPHKTDAFYSVVHSEKPSAAYSEADQTRFSSVFGTWWADQIAQFARHQIGSEQYVLVRDKFANPECRRNHSTEAFDSDYRRVYGPRAANEGMSVVDWLLWLKSYERLRAGGARMRECRGTTMYGSEITLLEPTAPLKHNAPEPTSTDMTLEEAVDAYPSRTYIAETDDVFRAKFGELTPTELLAAARTAMQEARYSDVVARAQADFDASKKGRYYEDELRVLRALTGLPMTDADAVLWLKSYVRVRNVMARERLRDLERAAAAARD